MHIITDPKPGAGRVPPQPAAKPVSAAPGQPQSSGLSRAELRKIVQDILG